MNCPNCGTSNLDNATLCIHCGRPLTAGSGTYTVPPAPPLDLSESDTGGSYTPPPPPPPPRQTGYTAPPPAGGRYTGPPIPNYLVQSILVTLCCCLPLGIVAIVFSAQVNSKLAAGDVAGAMDASNKAKMFCWIAFGIGIAVTLISLMFNGAMMFQAFQEGMNQ